MTPCSRCSGSHRIQHLDASNLQSVVSGKMSEFTGAVGELFSPGGFNGDFFTEIWSEATKSRPRIYYGYYDYALK